MARLFFVSQNVVSAFVDTVRTVEVRPLREIEVYILEGGSSEFNVHTHTNFIYTTNIETKGMMEWLRTLTTRKSHFLDEVLRVGDTTQTGPSIGRAMGQSSPLMGLTINTTRQHPLSDPLRGKDIVRNRTFRDSQSGRFLGKKPTLPRIFRGPGILPSKGTFSCLRGRNRMWKDLTKKLFNTYNPDMGDVLLGQVIGRLIGFLNWNLME
ncbi:hypothetical protein WN51_14316 [Melipona quadrifasciata]|uniref:Uncharacterized protein n=1 Tax=Melipona quadrifasciata TaxID=166423 RepID=A0A0M9A3L3_9HYME|nr:hypothetical protein WN51_14316 [Melipona quadrifasciata]